MERVSFHTEDGVSIVGSFSPGQAGKPAALLLHMMPATKESWTAFAESLNSMGWTTLAIDLRGHGESTRVGDKELHHQEFTNEQHQAKEKDVEAAVAWLEKHGFEKKRIVLAGASIGANLALAYAAAHREIPAVVALSPGINYRGVTAADKVAALKPSQHLLLAASADDEDSFEADRLLAKKKKGATLREFEGLGHGTAMLDHYPPLITEIIAWLTRIIQ